jgi:hypothetical protein
MFSRLEVLRRTLYAVYSASLSFPCTCTCSGPPGPIDCGPRRQPWEREAVSLDFSAPAGAKDPFVKLQSADQIPLHALVNTIMYRPVASVKPCEFPLDDHGLKDWSSRPRPRFPALAIVQRERVFRHESGAIHTPLRVSDCQFALGFESANLRKNRRLQRRRTPLRLPPGPFPGG